MKRKRQTYTVDEAAELLGIGRNGAYEGVKSGEIPSIRIGKRILVPKVALDRLLARDAGGTGNGDASVTDPAIQAA